MLIDSLAGPHTTCGDWQIYGYLGYVKMQNDSQHYHQQQQQQQQDLRTTHIFVSGKTRYWLKSEEATVLWMWHWGHCVKVLYRFKCYGSPSETVCLAVNRLGCFLYISENEGVFSDSFNCFVSHSTRSYTHLLIPPPPFLLYPLTFDIQRTHHYRGKILVVWSSVGA